MKFLAIYLITFWVSLEQTIVRTIFFPEYLSKRSSFFRPLEKGLLLQPHTGFSHHILNSEESEEDRGPKATGVPEQTGG